MCRADHRTTVNAVKRRCLGRQSCRFSPADVREMFPDDPCPGKGSVEVDLTLDPTC